MSELTAYMVGLIFGIVIGYIFIYLANKHDALGRDSE